MYKNLVSIFTSVDLPTILNMTQIPHTVPHTGSFMPDKCFAKSSSFTLSQISQITLCSDDHL